MPAGHGRAGRADPSAAGGRYGLAWGRSRLRAAHPSAVLDMWVEWSWARRAWPVLGAGKAVVVPGVSRGADCPLSLGGGPGQGRVGPHPERSLLPAVCSAAAGGLRRDELHNEVLHKGGGGGGEPVLATAPLLGGSPEKEGGGAASGDDFSELPRGMDGIRGRRAGPGSRDGLGWGQLERERSRRCRAELGSVPRVPWQQLRLRFGGTCSGGWEQPPGTEPRRRQTRVGVAREAPARSSGAPAWGCPCF